MALLFRRICTVAVQCLGKTKVGGPIPPYGTINSQRSDPAVSKMDGTQYGVSMIVGRHVALAMRTEGFDSLILHQ